MAPFKVRKDQRFDQSLPIQYRGDGIAGEGAVHDLSLCGGRVVGTVPVSVGLSLVLRISLPVEAEPLELDPVTVQWVSGMMFGVELGTPKPEVAERLTQLIRRLVQKHHALGFRPA